MEWLDWISFKIWSTRCGTNGILRVEELISCPVHKFVELLSCHFVVSQEDVVRQSILYRYNSMKVCIDAGVMWALLTLSLVEIIYAAV